MTESRIPKMIHFCWFGRTQMPDEVQRCIATWKRVLPDYEIMEWNEDNFCIDTAVPYVKEAYQKEMWAFVSDYVRLYALFTYGGIYFDTDIEVFRPFDEFLDKAAFFGFESNDYLTTAVMGCEKHSQIMEQFLEEYKTRHFLLRDGSMDIETTNVVALTRLMEKHGLILNGRRQVLDDAVIYPQWYFSPNDFVNLFGRYRARSFTYHHCNASWNGKKKRTGFAKKLRHYLLGIARNAIGTETLYRLRN